ncbi:hypothetical protein MRX96_006620 [Rhipicephalus microplus]
MAMTPQHRTRQPLSAAGSERAAIRPARRKPEDSVFPLCWLKASGRPKDYIENDASDGQSADRGGHLPWLVKHIEAAISSMKNWDVSGFLFTDRCSPLQHVSAYRARSSALFRGSWSRNASRNAALPRLPRQSSAARSPPKQPRDTLET